MARRQQLADEKGLYEDLRVAFGKKGVPAMIIEAAIPEIEDEANILLSRITAGGCMSALIRCARRSKARRSRRSTSRLRTSWARGLMRIFPARTVPRQLCHSYRAQQAAARRAGAQLQTLVMDEGFGQLDASGRERLVEVINAIQHDFARILVITHVEELRDAFPPGSR